MAMGWDELRTRGTQEINKRMDLAFILSERAAMLHPSCRLGRGPHALFFHSRGIAADRRNAS